jgi:hypothetical protein
MGEISGTLREDFSMYVIICVRILSRGRKVAGRSGNQTHILCLVTLPEHRAVYAVITKRQTQTGRM